MPIRSPLLCCALLVACASEPAQIVGDGPLHHIEHAATPHVVLVVWGSARADRMSAYDHTRETTPYAHQLARGGWLFERAVTASTSTLPAMASVFTGLSVAEHGATDAHPRLELSHQTLAEALRDGGYETFAFTSSPTLTVDNGLLQGFSTVHHPWAPGSTPTEARHIPGSGARAQEALEGFLAARTAGTPFFALVHLSHASTGRDPSGMARKTLMEPSVEAHARQADLSYEAQLASMGGTQPLTAQALDALGGVYDASLRDLDHRLRGLARALDKASLLDDTLLVLLSDHGESLGEHGRLGHGFSVHNEVTRVPLLLSWPEHLRAGRIEPATSTQDLFHVLVEAGRLPVEPALRRALGERARRGTAITEHTVSPQARDELQRVAVPSVLASLGQGARAVEWGDHKLILRADGTHTLYEVTSDPRERMPLVSETRRAAGVALLDASAQGDL